LAKINSIFIEFFIKILKINKDVTPDGNCLFRSVCDLIEGKEDNHSFYRELAISFVSNNKDAFLKFLAESEDINSHVQNMKKDGSWAGHIEILALCACLNVKFCLFMIDKPPLTIGVTNSQASSQKTLNLAYLENLHYASVRKNGDDSKLPAELFQLDIITVECLEVLPSFTTGLNDNLQTFQLPNNVHPLPEPERHLRLTKKGLPDKRCTKNLKQLESRQIKEEESIPDRRAVDLSKVTCNERPVENIKPLDLPLVSNSSRAKVDSANNSKSKFHLVDSSLDSFFLKPPNENSIEIEHQPQPSSLIAARRPFNLSSAELEPLSKRIKPLSSADIEMPPPEKIFIDLGYKECITKLHEHICGLQAKICSLEDHYKLFTEKKELVNSELSKELGAFSKSLSILEKDLFETKNSINGKELESQNFKLLHSNHLKNVQENINEIVNKIESQDTNFNTQIGEIVKRIELLNSFHDSFKSARLVEFEEISNQILFISQSQDNLRKDVFSGLSNLLDQLNLISSQFELLKSSAPDLSSLENICSTISNLENGMNSIASENQSLKDELLSLKCSPQGSLGSSVSLHTSLKEMVDKSLHDENHTFKNEVMQHLEDFKNSFSSQISLELLELQKHSQEQEDNINFLLNENLLLKLKLSRLEKSKGFDTNTKNLNSLTNLPCIISDPQAQDQVLNHENSAVPLEESLSSRHPDVPALRLQVPLENYMEVEMPKNSSLIRNVAPSSNVDTSRSQQSDQNSRTLLIPWKGRIICPTFTQLKASEGNLDLLESRIGSRAPMPEERNFKLRFVWKGFVLWPTPQELHSAKGDMNSLLKFCSNKLALPPSKHSYRHQKPYDGNSRREF